MVHLSTSSAVIDQFGVIRQRKEVVVCLFVLSYMGEASNIRFLPECLCYIFHHIAQPAKSCAFEGKVSFLDQVISPVYEVIAADHWNSFIVEDLQFHVRSSINSTTK